MLKYDIINNTNRRQSAGEKKSSLSGRQAAREILLLCTTSSVTASGKKRISQVLTGVVDWKYFLELAEFHGVVPLITHNLIVNGFTGHVPENFLKRLNKIYNGTIYRNTIYSSELEKVLSLFKQNGISVITLKGTVLAEQLYGSLHLRTIVDMDVLVQPGDLARARHLLLESGYRQLTKSEEWNHNFHDAPYFKQVQFPLFIELHWNVDDERFVFIDQNEIWKRALPFSIQERTSFVLSPEDNLLILSSHHIKQPNRLLRYLCDIAELLKKYRDTLDWDYIIKSACSWGIETSVYFALRQAKELIDAPVPRSAIVMLKPSIFRRWLLSFLVGREYLISPSGLTRQREATFIMVRAIMMKYPYQMLEVLSAYHSGKKEATGLKIMFSLIMVFCAALGRNAAKLLPLRKR